MEERLPRTSVSTTAWPTQTAFLWSRCTEGGMLRTARTADPGAETRSRTANARRRRRFAMHAGCAAVHEPSHQQPPL